MKFEYAYDIIKTQKGGNVATRKTASKTSKKAGLNIDIKSPSKTKTKKAFKTIKKLSPAAMVISLLFLIIGAAGGWFGTQFITKNDCFTLIGKEEITLVVGQSYTDQGAKVVSFNQDLSNKVKVETNLTKNKDGTYTSNDVGTFYMIYTVDSIKYNTIFKVQKIRLITFVEESEDPIISANILLEVNHD